LLPNLNNKIKEFNMSFKEFLQEEKGDKAAYQAFFNKMLKKFGVESADDLDADKKKEFYDAIDAGWEGDNEEKEIDESTKAYAASLNKIANDKKLNSISKSDKETLAKIAKLLLGEGTESLDEMKVDQSVTAVIKGKKIKVRIIALDSDKSVAVHVVEVKDPDKDHFVKRSDINEDRKYKNPI
jgi:hypothetical protein